MHKFFDVSRGSWEVNAFRGKNIESAMLFVFPNEL